MKRNILLVGIENYKDPKFDLSGVNNDIDKIQELFSDVYDNVNITILQNADADAVSIKKNFTDLLDKTQMGEQAIFYYSGHGTRIPPRHTIDKNEEDQRDDAILAYLSHKQDIVIDNWFHESIYSTLKRGASCICLFDSCHSGTMVKSFDLWGQGDDSVEVPKSVSYDSLTKGLSNFSGNINTSNSATTSNVPCFIQISAAHEEELAVVKKIDGERRSVFNWALCESLKGLPDGQLWSDIFKKIEVLVKDKTFMHSPVFEAQGGGEFLRF